MIQKEDFPPNALAELFVGFAFDVICPVLDMIQIVVLQGIFPLEIVMPIVFYFRIEVFRE